MMKKILQQYKTLSRTNRFLFVGWITLMVLMPFHAFISTWGGSTVGPYQVWKVWKEILLVALVIISINVAYKDKALFRKLVGSPPRRNYV